MAYKQVKKYGYRDSLEKGDPEKVIYGVDFDAEFEAIEEAFDDISGEDGTIGPEDPAFEDVVFQNRTEDQQVISKFTFSYENPLNGVFAEIDASNQSFNLSSLVQFNDNYQPWTFDIRGTMRTESPQTLAVAETHMNFASNGMGLDIGDTGEPFPNNLGSPAYVWYFDTGNKWKIKPGLDVEGDLNVDNNVTIGGAIEGDLTVNGNIIIDGGSIVDPDGNPPDGWWVEGDSVDHIVHSGMVEAEELLVRNTSNQQEINLTSSNEQLVGQPSIFTGPGSKDQGNGKTGYSLYLSAGDQPKPSYDLKLDNEKAFFTGEVTAEKGAILSDRSRVSCNSSGYSALSVSNSHATEGHVLLLRSSVPTASTNYILCQKADGTDERFKVTGDGAVTAAGPVNSGSFVKQGGTSSQLLCADGSVVDKGSVGGSAPDLSTYYTKTESDGRFKPIGYTAPVASVNGKTGAVSLTAADVGASTYTGADAVKTSSDQTIGGIKTFSSDIRAKANVYAYYGSDERLKDEIAPMPVGLIDAIDASTWKWKEDGRSSGGVIAQQLQEIGLDDWVREAPNGDLGVDYNALIGMLIAEVQDLKKKLSDV